MRKRVVSGMATLIVGAISSVIGVIGKYSLHADERTISANAVKAVSASLFVGIALIMLSAILFIRASGETKK